MAGFKQVFLFLLQSVVFGLAAAFVVVLLRPELLPVLDPGAAPPLSPASYADAVDRSAPAVASVYTRRLAQSNDGGNPGERFQLNTSLGSAVVIDSEGYLVTNYHVIADAAEIRLQLADGRIAEPTVVGFDAETDLALLKVDMGALPAVPLGRSDQLRIGDVVLAIGSPYGLTRTVTQGIVSATGRGLLQLMTFENFIQTDAAINEGNSGGALVNSLGQLVGINTAVLAQDAGTEGISFAIPVDLVRGVVDAIKRDGRVIRGWVGLEPEELTSAESEGLGLEPDLGIVLNRVIDGGPAADAGLRRGDVILSINGEAIRTRQQALLLVAGLEPGQEVEIGGWRDGQRFRATLTVAERPGR
ncbi:MAG: trypsin-like peptidase domain-containing protein [Gammaproteobacteria bacterium]|nr:trypsin-like peptidase domain-containing protein [Gammaproteobacteria bacterium]MDH4253772.1 trypsin-like peptidase domain-containing protein [Gammaproteobacteria bacterium]MDH5308655.1 trypsin-like peptidase domain-containing protein [Gammaproteobacteria bacterium]